ncbi:MAG: hypothetical protein AAFO29_24830 [Actinomycetota bacterium]
MTPDSFLDEEPWEAEVGALLQQLPSVDPPVGFIDAAIDHRPLHAGRILTAMVAVTLAVVGLVAATGVIERAGVVPPIDDLVVRHDLAARAGFSADDEAATDSPVSLPEGFQSEGSVAVEDLRQALYARGDESVSVFVQEGRVNWSGLPDGGLTELDDLPAWVDRGRRIAVIETAGSTVTVVGLDPEELTLAVQGLPRSSDGLQGRLSDLADAVVETFGYAPVG